MPQELKATPRSRGLGAIADALLRAKAAGNEYELKKWVPLLGGAGIGDLFLGRGPEEISEWSYGNAPMRVPEMTGVPQFKRGRADQLLDVTNLAPVVGGLGRLAGKGAMAAGRAGERLAERAVPRIMERDGVGAQVLRDLAQGSESNVIKQKGGNWLAGSVEDALRGLKSRNPLPKDLAPYDGGRWLSADSGEIFEDRLVQASKPREVLDQWIDKQLTRYVKNEMATPEDPVRALAERGVLHYAPQETAAGEGLRRTRKSQGFPEIGMAGPSDLAQTWEANSDFALYPPQRAGDLLSMAQEKGYDRMLNKNPWLGKVPPETLVNEAKLGSPQDLGFNHLIDELRNATNPESGLPRELLLKYESLPQVSVPQAVERVAKINEWRAAQKAEADMARANNAATVLHKDYPDAGFRWVELKAGDLPEGWRAEKDALGVDRLRGPEGQDTLPGNLNDPRRKALEDALKYEGDTMGHCVGGYCPDVVEGKSRIYSLRDTKGQPHVTVEVAPGKQFQIPQDDVAEEAMRRAEAELGEGADYEEITELAERMLRDIESEPRFSADRIVEIKGKANKAPNPEYLPYVQDFVKSGQWSDVGDLGNAGLRRTQDALNAMELEKLRSLGVEDIPQWVTGDDLNVFSEKLGSGLKYDPKGNIVGGYASGGLVQQTNDYDPARIDALVSNFQLEFA